MTLEDFKYQCLAAIAEHYDEQLDGPLLVAIRDQSHFLTSGWVVFPEYAAAIGHWPAGYLSDSEPDFGTADEAIATLASRAKRDWRERQPEPDDDVQEDMLRSQFSVEGKGA